MEVGEDEGRVVGTGSESGSVEDTDLERKVKGFGWWLSAGGNGID